MISKTGGLLGGVSSCLNTVTVSVPKRNETVTVASGIHAHDHRGVGAHDAVDANQKTAQPPQEAASSMNLSWCVYCLV